MNKLKSPKKHLLLIQRLKWKDNNLLQDVVVVEEGAEHHRLHQPLNAFQIILERIDGLRDVAIEHSNNLTTIQDQINLLVAKFEALLTSLSPLAIPIKRGSSIG